MLREGYSFVLQAPWISVSAGVAIFVIVLAFQMLADGLQSMLGRRGPTLQRRGTPG
jgi:peptide/nickel transport system permease protein/oligopeptide transport system permease protein